LIWWRLKLIWCRKNLPLNNGVLIGSPNYLFYSFLLQLPRRLRNRVVSLLATFPVFIFRSILLNSIGLTTTILRWLLRRLSHRTFKLNHGVVRGVSSFINWIQLDDAPCFAFCFLFQILLLFLQRRKRHLRTHSSPLRQVPLSLPCFLFFHFLFFFF